MKSYRFKYKEVNYGFIEVKAENKKEAYEKAQSLEGDIFINKNDWEVENYEQNYRNNY